MIQFSQGEPSERIRLAHGLFYLGKMEQTAPVVQWLEKELNRLDQANRCEPDPVVFRQRQGSLMAIENLLKEVSMADDRAKKMGKVVF